MEKSGEPESGESGQQVNYTKPATTRLTDQTYERFTQYTEQEGVGKSEGLRRLIRTGLDHDLDEEEDEEVEDEEDSDDHSVSDALLAFGIVLGLGVVGGYTSAGGNPDVTLVYITAAMIGGGLLLRSNSQQ
jgi:hypothetical protein